MKKQYIAPEINVINVDSVETLCTSGQAQVLSYGEETEGINDFTTESAGYRSTLWN